MLKKPKILTAILLMSSTAAFADNMLPYLGAEVGYDAGKWQIKDATSVKTTPSATGGFGGLFAGLSWNLAPQFVLNTELFGNESSTSTSNQTINIAGGGTSQAKMRMKYSYGVSLLPGFSFQNNAGMVYLRAGYIRSLFAWHQSIPPSTAKSNWGYTHVGGGQFGVGIQGNLGEAWGIRGEYDYVSYTTFTVFNNNITARDNQFKVGVLYNFH